MELFSFYNVENLFLPDPEPRHKLDPTISGLRNWNERKYKNKLYKIAHVFQLIKDENGTLPFIIGLSEVSGKQVLEDLIQMQPFNSEYGIVHYNSRDERKVDVAMLYDKNKVEIIDSEAITFFFENETQNIENYDTTRDVLYSVLKYKEEIINVFIAHLPSKREKDINRPKRIFILNEIQRRILDLINADENVILCGDFNENPDDENLVKFSMTIPTKRFWKILFSSCFLQEITLLFITNPGCYLIRSYCLNLFLKKIVCFLFKMPEFLNP